jgi:tRNA(fMet)-specific endonuclease VapC
VTAPLGETGLTGILDTNTVMLLAQVDPAQLPEYPLVTSVTLAELSVGPLATDDPTERAARQARLQWVEARFEPLPFDAAAARAFGGVAAGLRRSGLKPAARSLDAMIAATAIANRLPLYAANPRDFRGIDGLDLRTVSVPAPRT